MLKQRTPMSRGKGFKRATYTPAPSAPVRPATRRAVLARCDVAAKPVEKDNPLRSEAYRRLVAAMPCACGCGRQPCQAAHPNTGKGMGLKTDDRLCFPLAPPCHTAFDQGAMFPKEVRRQWELTWGRATRAAIIAAGTWPKNLPRWQE